MFVASPAALLPLWPFVTAWLTAQENSIMETGLEIVFIVEDRLLGGGALLCVSHSFCRAINGLPDDVGWLSSGLLSFSFRAPNKNAPCDETGGETALDDRSSSLARPIGDRDKVGDRFEQDIGDRLENDRGEAITPSI